MVRTQISQNYNPTRLKIIWGIFFVIFVIIIFRLFYLQIIKHDEFLAQANATQIKSLEIEAKRGYIYAFNDRRLVPLVINQSRWTMFADTKFIENRQGLIANLETLGVVLTDTQKSQLASDSRYVVLRKRLTNVDRVAISQNLQFRGVYFQKQAIRQYLEGDLAGQVLGFLNSDSVGQYGIEQYYHQELTGTPGRLRTTTDVHDIPLLFVEDNILIEPQAGQDVVLTLDIPLQRIAETELREGIENTDSISGSAIILDADTGAVLAMANYPTFDPADFQSADLADYINKSVENVVEPASVMKVLFMSAVLNEGVIGIDDNYYNPKFQVIDGLLISNFIFHEEGYLPVSDILARSLNTGTIEMLKRLGRNSQPDAIDFEDRRVLHKYLTQHFRLQQKTGIGLPNEVSGFIHPPDSPYSPNHLYATMTFGQSITATPLQLAAAYAAIFNGGNYYQPYITARIGDKVQEPKLLAGQILEPQTIADLRVLMVKMAERNIPQLLHDEFEISGKTGSAQVVDYVEGGYLEGESNGLMAGYIKTSKQTFVVIVVVEQPQVVYAGSQGARPIWNEIISSMVSLGRIIP